MKTIIEKEIERREALIADKAEKENKILEMQIEIEKLTLEIANTDEDTLRAEIAELETYLPTEGKNEAVCGDTETDLEIPTISLV